MRCDDMEKEDAILSSALDVLSPGASLMGGQVVVIEACTVCISRKRCR